MKIIVEVDKKINEMTFKEISTIYWPALTEADYKHATGREIAVMPLNIANHCLSLNSLKDVKLTDVEIDKLIKQPSMEPELLCSILKKLNVEEDFVLRRLEQLKKRHVTTAHLYSNDLIKSITKVTDMLPEYIINQHYVSLEDRLQYFKTSQFFNEWNDCDLLILKGHQFVELGFHNTFVDCCVETQVSSYRREFFYQEKFHEIVGDTALTWDNIIDIMYTYPKYWEDGLGALYEVWYSGHMTPVDGVDHINYPVE